MKEVGRGASAPEPALSPSATEPKVSAHSGNGQAQFTAGPWSTPGIPEGMEFPVFAADGGYVAGCAFETEPYSDTPPYSEARANADLIAAAPKMRDALKPFAAWGELCFSGHYGTLSDDEVMYASIVAKDGSKVRITAGDLRRVVAALENAAGASA